jgi:hypothetical protein
MKSLLHDILLTHVFLVSSFNIYLIRTPLFVYFLFLKFFTNFKNNTGYPESFYLMFFIKFSFL